MAKLTMVQALNLALEQEMSKDQDVVVMGEDVGRDGGVFRVTEKLFEKFGAARVIDTPLAESAIVGTAVGMAVAGMKPVAEIQFSGFIYPAFDQLINHAARFRNRSRGRFHCPLVVRAPYSGGIHAPEHHSESMENIYVHTPGLKVVIPSTPYDAKGLLLSAIRDPDPVLFLEPKRVYRSIKQDVPEEEYTIPLGKADIKREGGDVTLISWGSMVHVALEAAQKLYDEKKISAEVVDLRTLSPLDLDTVLTSVKKTGRCVIVHEAPRTSGFGAELGFLLQERLMLNLQAPVQRATGWDTIFPLAKLEHLYLPNATRVIKKVEKVMSF